MSKKAWSGRFTEDNSKLFERMNCSLGFDIRMFKEDILLNRVYSKNLNDIGILSDDELESIDKELIQVEKEISDKGIEIFNEGVEDIHMGVEELLTDKIGLTAKKMHTGKSRNDQVATDVRMYMLKEIDSIDNLLNQLLISIVKKADEYHGTAFPGYTHLRQAQPMLFSHYLLSFYEAFKRDKERLSDLIKRVSIMPLGSAALSGSGFPLDREFLRENLNFSKTSNNSLDAVQSRDFILEFLGVISIMSTNLSRLAEDFILYSSEHFKFIEISDKISTGSSIMPNKKNPDSLELTRGKTGRLIGNYVTLFTVLKSIPSTYNKDLQEDKESLFDSIDQIKDILNVTIILFDSLKIYQDNMKNSIDHLAFATELADYLASVSVPFREAHHVVGNIVKDCIDKSVRLNELKRSDLIKYHEKFCDIDNDWGSLENFFYKREIYGGTGLKSVKYQIMAAKGKLGIE